jgi:phage tail tape-measure protein
MGEVGGNGGGTSETKQGGKNARDVSGFEETREETSRGPEMLDSAVEVLTDGFQT